MKKSYIISIIILILISIFMLLHIIKVPDDTSSKALLKATKEKDTPKIKKILRYRTKEKGGRKYRNDTGYGSRIY